MQGYRCGLFLFSCKPLSLSNSPSSSECLGEVLLKASRLSTKKTNHKVLLILEFLLSILTKWKISPITRTLMSNNLVLNELLLIACYIQYVL